MSDGKVHCPQYIKDNIPFRVVAGLDLRGGLRLVYTVDVEEAIKDKRDRYFDEHARSSSRSPSALHTGDKPPTREELAKLEEKVHLEKPRDQSLGGQHQVRRPRRRRQGRRPVFETIPERDGRAAPHQGRRSLSRFAPRSSRAFASAPSTRPRTPSPSRRRARPARGGGDRARRGHHHRGPRRRRDAASPRSATSSARRRASSSRCSTTTTDFFGAARQERQGRRDLPKGLTLRNSRTRRSGRERQTKPSRTTRVSSSSEQRDDARGAEARSRSGSPTLNVPADHEIGYGKSCTTPIRTTLKQSEVGWRTYYLFSKAEITGDMVRDAQAVPDQSERGLGRLARGADLHRRGRRPLRGDHRRATSSAASRSSSTTRSRPRRSSRARSPAATRRSRWARATPSQQLADARKLELVLRSGALPAPDLAVERAAHRPVARQRRHRAGRARARSPASLLVLVFMVVYYQPRRRHRRHRGALQPAPPARDPRDASAPR